MLRAIFISQLVAVAMLSSDSAQFTSGPWVVYNNVWGKANLINGVDYTQKIILRKASFPNGTLLSWSWPSQRHFYSYPEIIYGSTPWSKTNPEVLTIQLANLANVSVDYSTVLEGSLQGYDTIFDIWLTSQPNGNAPTVKYELEVVTHANWTMPASRLAYTLTDSTLRNVGVYVTPGETNGVATWTNICLLPQGDIPSGSISISDIIKSLIWHGIVPATDYVSGVEFGAEPQSGSGSVLISALDYQWNARPAARVPVGARSYSVTTLGGNNIVGNGDTDTVIYQGAFAQYQIRQSGIETLVRRSGDISTLDVLTGITFIQFSDGTFGIGTSSFVANQAGPK
jgi:hypothetical protein